MSIDGPEEINDQLRGKGSYKKAIAAIEKLAKGKILNGLACAITTINYKHLDHVCELAEKYHANFVWYNHLVPSGRAKDNNRTRTLHPKQYEWVLNHIWDITQKYEGKFEIHVHCPHFARVVKQRNIPNFDEWYEQRVPRQMHLLRIRRLRQRNRKRRPNPLLLHRPHAQRTHDARKHPQQNPSHKHGKKSKRHPTTAASKTATSSKANAASANTAKSAADAETEPTPTQATCPNPTQPAATSQRNGLKCRTKKSKPSFPLFFFVLFSIF